MMTPIQRETLSFFKERFFAKKIITGYNLLWDIKKIYDIIDELERAEEKAIKYGNRWYELSGKLSKTNTKLRTKNAELRKKLKLQPEEGKYDTPIDRGY